VIALAGFATTSAVHIMTASPGTIMMVVAAAAPAMCRWLLIVTVIDHQFAPMMCQFVPSHWMTTNLYCAESA
jgi:hypothetical protein